MTQDPDNYKETAYEKILEAAMPKLIPPSFALESSFGTDESQTLRIFMGDRNPLIDRVIIHGPADLSNSHDMLCVMLYDNNTFKVLHGNNEITNEDEHDPDAWMGDESIEHFEWAKEQGYPLDKGDDEE